MSLRRGSVEKAPKRKIYRSEVSIDSLDAHISLGHGDLDMSKPWKDWTAETGTVFFPIRRTIY
jgi:hypothetical protein